MKHWQFGYELDFLKTMEDSYSHYNSFAASPFGKYKKNDIAKDFNDECMANYFVFKTVKVRTPIIPYNNGPIIGVKQPGDLVITKIRSVDEFAIFACNLHPQNQWVYVWAEDIELNEFLVVNQYKYVGSKVTTFGEIYAIYFKDSMHTQSNEDYRKHPIFDPVEKVCIRKMGYTPFGLVDEIKDALSKVFGLEHRFTNHYSNYNKDKSWSAFSLRGYSPDAGFITKPEEMNKKWHEKNSGPFILQDTALYDQHFGMIKEYLHSLFDGDIHRVRFMKLQPGGGELERHTDQTDPDCGLQTGQITRFHFPIITNPKMEFNVWDLKGIKKTVHMKESEIWLLDTRKPHMAINNGDEPRIHLVVDTVVTKKMRQSILLNA